MADRQPGADDRHQQVTRPVLKRGISEAGTISVSCPPILAFCRRAQAAGFWPTKRGAIGHRCLVDVLPDGAVDYKVRFPKANALSRHEPTDEAVIPPPRDAIGGHRSLLVLPDGLVDGDTRQRYQDVSI